MKSLRNIIANYADKNENSYDEHELTAKDIVMKENKKRITLLELSGWLVVGGLLALVGLGTRVTKI